MTEWIKCNHLTDRWKQFKSIPTLTEYELGNLLFYYSFFCSSSFHYLPHTKNFSHRIFFVVVAHLSLLIHLPTDSSIESFCLCTVYTVFAIFVVVFTVSIGC